jgi:signal transduction histidine kinase
MMKRYILFIILVLVGLVTAYPQRKDLDSLTRVLATTPDEKKIDVYQEIIINLWLNHPDSAMGYAREALRLSNKLDDVRTKAIALRLIGGVHYYQGSYDSTIKYSYDAYAYSQVSNDSTLMSSSMNNIGLAYYNLSSYPEALEYLLRALNLKIKIKQEYGYAQTLNNVGLVYSELKDYERARQYFNRAKKVSEEKNDKDQTLYSLNNLGFTHIDQKDYIKAQQYFERSLRLAETIDNANWHASAYSGLAQVHYNNNNPTAALALFRKSLTLRENISDQSGIAEIYSYLGSIYTGMGKKDSARIYLLRSQAIAAQIQDKDQMMFNYDLLKQFYVNIKRFDSALYYQTKFIALNDTVYNDNLARNIKGIQMQIEREESESRLAAKDSEIRKITAQTYFLFALIIMSVIGSTLLYKSYRAQGKLTADLVKTNKEITEQKEEIHKQRDKLAFSHRELETAKEIIYQKNIELSKLNWQLQNTVNIRTKELEQANQELKVVNLELDNFIYRSSHDIRGPLVRLLGICHVALLDIPDGKAREYFTMLYDAAQQLNEIFDRLKTVSHINETQIHPVRIDFDEMLNQVLDRLKSMDGFDEVEIVRENGINEWFSDRFLLELVLLNMIENSIRFQKKSTSEKKFVKIRTARNGHHLKMAVIDNGIGIKEPDLENLYKMFSKAARDHRNVGLGLYIVKQCMTKLNGSIHLVDNQSGYTEFELIHPMLNNN